MRPPELPSSSSPPPPAPGPLRVLVVEDDLIQAQAMELMLAGLGYSLNAWAATPAEAEAAFRQQVPDVLLLDIELGAGPGNDGIALAHRLLQVQALPIVFLTSHDDEATFARARLAGPAAFLIKPCRPDVLRHTLELAVQQFVRQQGAIGAASPETGLPVRDSLFVRNGSRLDRLPLRLLRWVETDSSYCHLHTLTRKYTILSSLRDLEERLPMDGFVRIHRGYLVALEAIEALEPQEARLLVDGNWLPVGRVYREEVFRRLHALGWDG